MSTRADQIDRLREALRLERESMRVLDRQIAELHTEKGRRIQVAENLRNAILWMEADRNELVNTIGRSL